MGIYKSSAKIYGEDLYQLLNQYLGAEYFADHTIESYDNWLNETSELDGTTVSLDDVRNSNEGSV